MKGSPHLDQTSAAKGAIEDAPIPLDNKMTCMIGKVAPLNVTNQGLSILSTTRGRHTSSVSPEPTENSMPRLKTSDHASVQTQKAPLNSFSQMKSNNGMLMPLPQSSTLSASDGLILFKNSLQPTQFIRPPPPSLPQSLPNNEIKISHSKLSSLMQRMPPQVRNIMSFVPNHLPIVMCDNPRQEPLNHRLIFAARAGNLSVDINHNGTTSMPLINPYDILQQMTLWCTNNK